MKASFQLPGPEFNYHTTIWLVFICVSLSLLSSKQETLQLDWLESFGASKRRTNVLFLNYPLSLCISTSLSLPVLLPVNAASRLLYARSSCDSESRTGSHFKRSSSILFKFLHVFISIQLQDASSVGDGDDDDDDYCQLAD